MTILVCSAAAAFLALVWNAVLLGEAAAVPHGLASGQHFGEGTLPFWQMNVTRREHYTPEGRRLLRWLSLAQIFDSWRPEAPQRNG